MVPGILLLILELLALAAVGFLVAQVGLRERHDLVALAQGMAIGPALWGLAVNFILYLIPGLAGAAVGWGLVLTLGGGLAWRGRTEIALAWRRLAGFAAVALALLWVMLAARQLLKIPDPDIHLGLSAYIRAGGWPPTTPWNPDSPVFYHHGIDLLVALLAPPTGPGPVLVTELLGAYMWTSFALIVATALLRRGGWRSALLLSPLLLSGGAWTLLGLADRVPNLLQAPVPTDLQKIGLRDSLAGLYWPDVPVRWQTDLEGAPANIWKPPFVLSYALAFVVLWQAARDHRRSRTAKLTLAALIGFLGLASEEIALLVAGLWGALELWPIVASGRSLRSAGAGLLRAAWGPATAVALVAVGGAGLTALLVGAPRAELSISWIDDPFARQTFGRLDSLQGRIGLLGIGAVSTATIALALGWRDRLVAALAVGTLPLMAAALMLEYPMFPTDLTRLDGHARNFALLALLLAAAARLCRLDRHWRSGASALIAVLVIWPTVALPVRTIGLGVGRGVQITDPQHGVVETDFYAYAYDLRRFAVATPLSPEVAAYIRDETAVDTRVFSPHPAALSFATGRPNATGLMGRMHLRPFTGPEFEDVLRYLEPGALRRRGFGYLHATDAWIKELPDHAQRWLEDPQSFERVVRTESDALYRIQPAFRQLAGAYAPASYEALRQAVPAKTAVYLAPGLEPRPGLRIASVLAHTQLLGSVDLSGPYLMTRTATKPLSTQKPDLVVLPARMAPSSLDADARRPLWWNHEVAVYAPRGNVAPITDPPPKHFSVELSDVRLTDRRLAFTATFTDRATDRWQGQDWVVVATDVSAWRLPHRFGTAAFTSVFVRWFDGQVVPVPETETHEYFFLYEFEPRTGALGLWDGRGYRSLSEPQEPLAPGTWMLAARPNVNREEVGLIPVLHFTLADDGSFTFTVYEGSLDATLDR